MIDVIYPVHLRSTSSYSSLIKTRIENCGFLKIKSLVRFLNVIETFCPTRKATSYTCLFFEIGKPSFLLLSYLFWKSKVVRAMKYKFACKYRSVGEVVISPPRN